LSPAELFASVEFDPISEPMFMRIAAMIESNLTCSAKLYKPPHMNQIRAAHFAPGETQEKAKNVFLLVDKRRGGLTVWSRRRLTGGRPKSETMKVIKENFQDWNELEIHIKQLCALAKDPRAPRTEWDFGDGIALPGGLPETNRRKF
jgi:hypothetical protein